MEDGDLGQNGDISRRKALAALVAAGAAAVASPSWTREQLQTRPPTADGDGGTGGTGDPSPSDPQPSEPQPSEPQPSEPQPPEDAMVARLEEFGGVADGRTDDTDALMAALEAVPPGGTVLLPPGDILIGTGRDVAIRLNSHRQGVTIQGSGPHRTRLLMAPGHESVHRGIVIDPADVAADRRIVIRDLTLDGRGLDQKFNIANGIEVQRGDGRGVDLEIRNCVVRDWATNGIQLREPGARIYDCSILQNGRKQEQMTGRDGHGISAAIGNNPNGEVIIDGCLMQGNTGAGADNGGGNMTIRNSVIDDCGYGVKQNKTTNRQVIENTRISNIRTEPGIYNIPPDDVGGELVLNSVVIEGGTDPGILLPAGGKISGDGIVIRGTNTEGSQPAQFVVNDEGRTFDIGRLAVLDTSRGTDVYFKNSTGSIGELVYNGSKENLGPFGGVQVWTTTRRLFGVDVPTVNQVGIPIQRNYVSL